MLSSSGLGLPEVDLHVGGDQGDGQAAAVLAGQAQDLQHPLALLLGLGFEVVPLAAAAVDHRPHAAQAAQGEEQLLRPAVDGG